MLALAPLRASLELFDQAGMAALRAKSEQLTGHLEQLIHARLPQVLQIVTPAEPARRGCQLSLRVAGGRAQDAHCSNICGQPACLATGANRT